jgi:MarR family transcriptional regulator, transcriptional regulator for hemolysin
MQEAELMGIANEIYLYEVLLLKFFNQAVEERLKNYGATITSLQLGVLRMLQFETLTISTISQRMGLDPASMVRIVDALERDGLAARGVDPHDRRRNPIQITPKGRELVVAIPVISENDPTFQALRSLGPEALLQLRALLRQAIQQFPEGKLVSGLVSGPPGVHGEPDSQHE